LEYVLSEIILPEAPLTEDEKNGVARPSGGVVYRDDRGENHVFWGGSFFEAPLVGAGLFRVNLMAERGDLPSDLWLPIKDYRPPSASQIPAMIALFEDILSRPNDTYAGCWGGVGRTGTFLASFLSYLGSADPVLQARWGLGPKAVETAEQQEFVIDFPLRSPKLTGGATFIDRPPSTFQPRRSLPELILDIQIAAAPQVAVDDRQIEVPSSIIANANYHLKLKP
jgi:hypothetical protein